MHSSLDTLINVDENKIHELSEMYVTVMSYTPLFDETVHIKCKNLDRIDKMKLLLFIWVNISYRVPVEKQYLKRSILLFIQSIQSKERIFEYLL